MATTRKAAPKATPSPGKAVKAAMEKRRACLRDLIGRLPAGELGHVQRYLEFLVATTTDDPVLRSVLLAPEDDEPETPEERAAVRRAKADFKASRVVYHEEMKRRFGL